VLSFNATLTNLLNQHSPTSYWEDFGSNYSFNPLFPFQIFGGANFYQTVETGYNAQQQITSAGVIQNSLYGKPNLWQVSRTIRVGAQFTF
jgi:hypothetical protein